MFNNAYVRVAAPGLPSWPKLLLDLQRNRAIVSFRLATWRSWAWAHQVSATTAWVISGLSALWFWKYLEFVGNPIARIGLTWFGWTIVMTIARSLVPAAFDGFLARQLFSSRITTWFTSDAIAFRSRLYDNGVLLWRKWQGRPIRAKFDVTADPNAAEERASSREANDNLRLQTAQILRLVIASFDPHRSLTDESSTNLVRAIPMAEVDAADAQKVTVVLAAAAAMTGRAERAGDQTASGLDIDSGMTRPQRRGPSDV